VGVLNEKRSKKIYSGYLSEETISKLYNEIYNGLKHAEGLNAAKQAPPAKKPRTKSGGRKTKRRRNKKTKRKNSKKYRNVYF